MRSDKKTERSKDCRNISPAALHSVHMPSKSRSCYHQLPSLTASCLEKKKQLLENIKASIAEHIETRKGTGRREVTGRQVSSKCSDINFMAAA